MSLVWVHYRRIIAVRLLHTIKKILAFLVKPTIFSFHGLFASASRLGLTSYLSTIIEGMESSHPPATELRYRGGGHFLQEPLPLRGDGTVREVPFTATPGCYFVEWQEGDIRNPQAWSNQRKWVVTALCCLMSFFVYVYMLNSFQKKSQRWS